MRTASIYDDEFINDRSAVQLAQGYLAKYADDVSISDISYQDLVDSFLGLIEEAESDQMA